MELFIPSRDWAKLKRRLEAYAEEITFFAGNARGEFESSDAESINPVTWGVFRGKEYVSFCAGEAHRVLSLTCHTLSS